VDRESDIEYYILKGIFESTSYFRKVACNIEDKYFSYEKGLMLKCVQEHFSKYEKVPEYSVALNSLLGSSDNDALKREIEEAFKEVKALKFDPESEGAWLFDQTKRFANERAMFLCLKSGAKEISKDPAERDYESIHKKMTEAVSLNWDDDLGLDYFDEIQFDETYDFLSDATARIALGVDELDAATCGGIPGKTKFLAVVVGSAGLGKSLLLSNMASNAVKDGKNVLYLTFEIDEKELRKRIDASFADISIGNIMSLRSEVKKRIIDAKVNGGAGRFIIKEFPPASVSALQVETFIHNLRLKKQFKPDIIVLDYMGIMAPISPKSCGNSYEKGKAVCEEIRALSDRLKCPILSAAQTNRCLALDTMVFEREKGHIKIRDIVLGDNIKNDEGFVEVKKIFPITRQKCYKIKTKSGREIICSGRHEFPTKKGLKSLESGLGVGDMLRSDWSVHRKV